MFIYCLYLCSTCVAQNEGHDDLTLAFKKNFLIKLKGYARYTTKCRYISQHGPTTAMQHLVSFGKILRGLSD